MFETIFQKKDKKGFVKFVKQFLYTYLIFYMTNFIEIAFTAWTQLSDQI